MGMQFYGAGNRTAAAAVTTVHTVKYFAHEMHCLWSHEKQ